MLLLQPGLREVLGAGVDIGGGGDEEDDLVLPYAKDMVEACVGAVVQLGAVFDIAADGDVEDLAVVRYAGGGGSFDGGLNEVGVGLVEEFCC